MPEELVNDEELLYRRVPQGRGLYTQTPDGGVVFSSQLFSDREKRASVDRAKLCNADPAYTQHDPSDGVVGVVARDVRGITGFIQYDANQRPVQTSRADVLPDPITLDNLEGLPPNPAHALIVTDPFPPSKGVYRRLLESLAILAATRGWEIRPQELRPAADEAS
jgi:hypothetical protein